MADREKVIKGLELCIPPYQCSPAECPYYFRQNNEGVLDWHCWDRLITDALALLKEQPEIVRCKGCKHYDGNGTCMKNGLAFLTDNWFCADGERR